MGTGAVGGFFGAKLAMASHDVIFIARGNRLEAMRRHGLIINSSQGDLHVRTPCFVGAPAEARVVDLVLFCALESRKPLEYEAFNGIVVKLLRAAGMAAPVNQVFYGALKYLDQEIRGTA